MDWTRGQNILFSSAAPTVNELRGPCDVANLLSLFGLSKERANAAISKNCRLLLANSLKKKRFYKEAISVEVLSSDATSQSKEDQYQELLKWDPISSGEGDIMLDNIQKSSLALCKSSKTAKAINFASVVNNLPSHGFEIKDILPANNAFPVSPDNKINSPPAAKKLNQSTPVPNNLTEQSNIIHVCPQQHENSLSDAITRSHILSRDNIFEKNIHSGTTEAVNFKERNKILTATDSVSVAVNLPSHDFEIKDILPTNSALPVFPDNKPDRLDVCPKQDESSRPLKQSDDFLEKNIHRGTIEAFNSMEMDTLTNSTNSEVKSSIDSDVNIIPFEAELLDSQSNLCISRNTVDTIKSHDNDKLCGSSEDARLDDAHNIDQKEEIMDIIFLSPVHDKHTEKNSDVNLNQRVGKIHETLPNEDLKIAEQTILELNTSISDAAMEDKQFDKRETDALELDEMQQLTSYDEMKVEDDSTATEFLLPEVIMKDKKLGEVSTDSDLVASVHYVSGGLRVKRRTRRGLPLFPFKRFLNPIPFKKKGKKSKSRTKLK